MVLFRIPGEDVAIYHIVTAKNSCDAKETDQG